MNLEIYNLQKEVEELRNELSEMKSLFKLNMLTSSQILDIFKQVKFVKDVNYGNRK